MSNTENIYCHLVRTAATELSTHAAPVEQKLAKSLKSLPPSRNKAALENLLNHLSARIQPPTSPQVSWIAK